MRVGIIACSSTKLDKKARVADMYSPSTLFSYAYKYARKEYDEVYFLSSKYGLLSPGDEVEPYNVLIEKYRKDQLHKWAHTVALQIQNTIPKGSELYLHIGDKYKYFIKLLGGEYLIHFPLKGIGGIGKQLQFYKKELEEK